MNFEMFMIYNIKKLEVKIDTLIYRRIILQSQQMSCVCGLSYISVLVDVDCLLVPYILT